MVDIQSTNPETRRGKKKDRRKKKLPQGKNDNVRICYTQGGHKHITSVNFITTNHPLTVHSFVHTSFIRSLIRIRVETS